MLYNAPGVYSSYLDGFGENLAVGWVLDFVVLAIGRFVPLHAIRNPYNTQETNLSINEVAKLALMVIKPSIRNGWRLRRRTILESFKNLAHPAEKMVTKHTY